MMSDWEALFLAIRSGQLSEAELSEVFEDPNFLTYYKQRIA